MTEQQKPKDKIEFEGHEYVLSKHWEDLIVVRDRYYADLMSTMDHLKMVTQDYQLMRQEYTAMLIQEKNKIQKLAQETIKQDHERLKEIEELKAKIQELEGKVLS